MKNSNPTAHLPALARLLSGALAVAALSLTFVATTGCQGTTSDTADSMTAGSGGGNSEQSDGEQSDGEQSDGDANAATASTADASVDVELADYDGVMKFVAASTGKVVVLDVWSTSCLPCMQEFPNLVELSKKYPEQVQCVSLNVDYIGLKKKGPETYVPAVEKFLTAQKAQLKNFVSTESDEATREHFGIGAIPAIVVYGPDGTVAGTLTDSNAAGDGLSYETDVIPLVEKLLASE